ncbi:hypothetical protein JL720_8502 [Aureococcus anophagefferens]|nr:hypothetical protein JL720_8502 [Aureococcus anophagefferens]
MIDLLPREWSGGEAWSGSERSASPPPPDCTPPPSDTEAYDAPVYLDDYRPVGGGGGELDEYELSPRNGAPHDIFPDLARSCRRYAAVARRRPASAAAVVPDLRPGVERGAPPPRAPSVASSAEFAPARDDGPAATTPPRRSTAQIGARGSAKRAAEREASARRAAERAAEATARAPAEAAASTARRTPSARDDARDAWRDADAFASTSDSAAGAELVLRRGPLRRAASGGGVLASATTIARRRRGARRTADAGSSDDGGAASSAGGAAEDAEDAAEDADDAAGTTRRRSGGRRARRQARRSWRDGRREVQYRNGTRKLADPTTATPSSPSRTAT